MRLLIKSAGLAMCMILAGTTAQAQAVDTVWTRNFWSGGFDSANSIAATADGGFIITGYSQPFGVAESDIVLIKTYADGTEQWTRYIGSDTTYETGYHVLQTFDGGYLVSAWSDAFVSPGGFRIWIVRTNGDGDTLWTFPLTAIDRSGFPLAAVQTSDSGFAVTGTINMPGLSEDAFVLRLDRDGNYLGTWTIGGADHQDAWFIAQMPDSGFLLAGHDDNIWDGTNYDPWVCRLDKLGAALWDSSYALSTSYDGVRDAYLDTDGLVLVGTVAGIGHALKVSFEDGHRIWSRSVSRAPYDESPQCICGDPDGGYLAGGWLGVSGHRRDYSFIKLDAAGDTLWWFTVGGSQDDHGRDLLPAADGFVQVGTSHSWGGQSIWLVKIGEVGTDVPDEPEALPAGFALAANYPNPFNPGTIISYTIPYRTHVQLTVYNTLGQEITVLDEGMRSAGTHSVTWDGRNRDGTPQATGVYHYRLEAGSFVSSRKMLLLK